jgi:hypothetical protein
MNDERMKALMDPAGEIADYKRMVYGGFEVIVDWSYRRYPATASGDSRGTSAGTRSASEPPGRS